MCCGRENPTPARSTSAKMLQEDTFSSVAWDTPPIDRNSNPDTTTPYHYPSEDQSSTEHPQPYPQSPVHDHERSSLTRRRSTGELGSSETPAREGYLDVQVKQPVRELEGTKDTFVSYLVIAKVRPSQKPVQTCSRLGINLMLMFTMFHSSTSDRQICRYTNQKHHQLVEDFKISFSFMII